MRIFVTGAAGFIGFHLAKRLLDEGWVVHGFDGLTAYGDVALKRDRLALLREHGAFEAHVARLEDMPTLEAAAREAAPDVIVHLAAQAGVRYSLENPRAFVDSNLLGAFNLLEAARLLKPKHLLMASTSSVYGAGPQTPFHEESRTDRPLTLYAASKKANEVMAHAYAHLHDIPTTMFRFFTVYGPWGRTDMAPFKFVNAIEKGEPIDVYNNGVMARDFTFVDDLVEGILRLIELPPAPGSDGASPDAPFRVVNIGRGEMINLLDFIATIEEKLGKTAIRNYLPMQQGDVPQTFANCDLLERLTGYRPGTSVGDGIAALVAWYRDYYGRPQASRRASGG
ncbi:MAG TPA: NAD-dependent epimerase/dehydratase family protein [Methylocystis sp.]|nr:NAD-dependent epimerase/dehydratase family protein [Methylocystis sp.]